MQGAGTHRLTQITCLDSCHSLVAAQAAATGGSRASRRRSQRLAKQGRPPCRTPDLELLEREARVAHLQQLRQQQQLPPVVDETSAAAYIDIQGQAEVPGLEEQGQNPWQAADGQANEPAVAVVGLEEAPAVQPSRKGSSAGAVMENVVEADCVLEQQGGQPPVQSNHSVDQSDVSRQCEALLAIMQAGERVEEVIAHHRTDIDATMLQLLARRMEAAEQLEKQAEVLQGLQLLYRRLKAEVDRQQASPELHLLDELMCILDSGEDAPRSLEERRMQAISRLRAAFTGGLADNADVLSLAAQLSSNSGSQLADQLVADPVDPFTFMAEATELLHQVQEQQNQLEAYLQEQQLEEQEGDIGQRRQAVHSTLEAQELLEQRQAGIVLLQECLQLAQAVLQQL